jgi:hypothetical protein
MRVGDGRNRTSRFRMDPPCSKLGQDSDGLAEPMNGRSSVTVQSCKENNWARTQKTRPVPSDHPTTGYLVETVPRHGEMPPLFSFPFNKSINTIMTRMFMIRLKAPSTREIRSPLTSTALALAGRDGVESRETGRQKCPSSARLL